ncbi:MAG: YbjN domain-containing protein [Bacteroidales bacterium]|nr:YbjN domain-containing protein [Bacteroidales bacterium]
MNTMCSLISETCQKLGYKVKEVNECIVIVRYQMHFVHICFNQAAPEDCTVMAAVVQEVSDDERLQVLEHCNELNDNLKHFKYYIMDTGVVATIEFSFRDADNLAFQLERAVRYISNAKAIFEKKMNNQ